MSALLQSERRSRRFFDKRPGWLGERITAAGKTRCFIASAVGAFLPPTSALAAPALDGASMPWFWALPFLGILLSIAVGPLLFARLWHHHYGKAAAAWALLALTPLALRDGVATAWGAFVHAMLAEYLSFIVLLFALYVVAGGILVTSNIRGTPIVNAAMLAVGAAMASFVGTTGAAMILIRPLLSANVLRTHRVHVVVFFIILVANIGGALTPLGDPPLFVGFLRGVDFFWPAQHLWIQTAITGGIVLGLFLATDWWFYRKSADRRKFPADEPLHFRVQGSINFVLIALIVATILFSAAWKPGVEWNVSGTNVSLESLTRDVSLVLIALFSLWLTPNEHREANGFTWEPIREVAILFAAIFVAIVPVLAMLQAGRQGLFAPVLNLITGADGAPREVAYFWLTGLLSAFLDNAPTYLVFFELASGDAQKLMTELSGTLAAISLGAVIMGALTYVGNAPNFMVYAIATERGIAMPSFFVYLFWAALILVPILVLLTLLPIPPMIRLA
jgi:Na+/H+ antiporter NhaD/arsenite permease-like protein